MTEDLVQRLRKRAEIRRQITTRKSVQNNEPDRIAELLEEAANRIGVLEANHKIQLDINEKALQYIAELEKGLESSLNLNKAQAERNTDNEPVAWMLADKEKEHIRSIMAVQHDFVPEGCVEIPLYTHPHPDNLGFALSIIDQQKLEIEELKQYTKKGNGLLAECDEHMGKLQALILKQDARIAELEKETHSINYTCPNCETHVELFYKTPQIKELSDAEISQISHRYHYTYNPDYVGFARAILKKASER
jgi:hypothetical protein